MTFSKKFLLLGLFLSLFFVNSNIVYSLNIVGQSCEKNIDCFSDCCFWDPNNEVALPPNQRDSE